MATNVNTNTALVQVDVRTTTKTVTLPLAAQSLGRAITIKDKHGNAQNNPITIQTLGSDLIDNLSPTYTLSNTNAAVLLVSDGVSRWMTLNSPSVPFLGSTLSLSAATIYVSSIGANSLQFSTGKGLAFTVSSFAGTTVTASTVQSGYFIGDGSRLTNLNVTGIPYTAAQYNEYTVSSGTSYTAAPWGSQQMFLSTLFAEQTALRLNNDGFSLYLSTGAATSYRVSYMCGGNQNTVGTARPTLTMVLSTPTSINFYPTVNTFEGGGGSVSFLETFTPSTTLSFLMRGLENYSFIQSDAFFYRISFETILGGSVDFFSTFNTWTATNRFISSLQLDGGFTANGGAFNGTTSFETATATTFQGQFVGDGSRLTNVYSGAATTPLYSEYTISSGTSYTASPWGSVVPFITPIGAQQTPIQLNTDGVTFQVSTTATTTAFRISYMCGGNQTSVGYSRPTLTMVLSTPTSINYYPTVNTFEGGGGSVSFLENLAPTATLYFLMRGLENYTFTTADSYLYRISFETIVSPTVALLSTFNIWSATNRFISTAQFDGGLTASNSTIVESFAASDTAVFRSSVTFQDFTSLQGAIVNLNLSTIGNLGVGGNTSIVGTTSIGASATIGGTLSTGGAATIGGSAIIGGATTVAGTLVAQGTVQSPSYYIYDQGSATYRLITLNSGYLYADATLISGGGGGGSVSPQTLAALSSMSTVLVGFSSPVNTIRYYGRTGNYDGTVLAEQSTGQTTAELLLFKGSSIGDQVRIQTTGNFILETGVSQRNFAAASQQSVPRVLVNAAGNVGINVSSPQHMLDVAGSARFTTLTTGALFLGVSFV
jgi:hypothetical protein